MYRLGLSRKRIAELVRAEPATVGYHLVIARSRDPELEAAHLAAVGTKAGPSPGERARMEEIAAWIKAEARLPRDRSEDKKERSWPGGSRTDAAKQPRGPSTRPTVTVWPRCQGGRKTAGNPRTKNAGTAASPSSRPTARKATTGPATRTAILNGNIP
jgi:hypothetical protein